MEALRKCRECGLEAHTEKELELFAKSKESKYGRGNLCSACSTKRSSKWKANNRDKANKQGKETRVKNKKRAIETKGGKCISCGIEHNGTNDVIFDFHHLDPTEKEVDPGKLMGGSWEKVEKEISKCVLLCANCHRLEHN
jgi:hypothetical protein